MKLPVIRSFKSKSPKLIKDKYKITIDNNNSSIEDKLESFTNKLNEVQEIKIYLSKNFNAYDVDEVFIKDMEMEYAEQYLNKLQMLPTKPLIKKLLSLRPLENCDFYLSNDSMVSNGIEKQMKIIHIYPHAFSIKKKLNQSEDNMKNYLSKNIESSIKKNYFNENRELKEKIINIKKNNKSEIDQILYNKEKIDEIFNKDYDELEKLKLFSKENTINVCLSFENIKKKYIIIKKIEDYKMNEKIINCKGKFFSLSNSISGKKNILNDPKYTFDITEINNFNNDIIKEVTEPLDVQLGLVMKDINYILDHFPFEKFINIDDDIDIKKNNEISSSQRSNTLGNNHHIYRINLDKKEDIIQVLKIFHSMEFCRLISLTLNLVYWIVFGNQNKIQIDGNTKEYIYLKLLHQIDIVNSKISNKLLSKVFVPLEIVLIRIEIDNYLSRKFKLLFDDKYPQNKEKIMIIINNIITEIFDKHGYMNSFETICGSREEFNKKITRNLLPRFKQKIFATNNMVEQLFNNDKNNISKNSMELIKERQDFIMGPKADFFNSYLKRINKKLKKRSLEPIFIVSNNKRKNNNNKNNNKDSFLSEDNIKTQENERYTNVAKYMDNALIKFRDLSSKPKRNIKMTISKTEGNY